LKRGAHAPLAERASSSPQQRVNFPPYHYPVQRKVILINGLGVIKWLIVFIDRRMVDAVVATGACTRIFTKKK
jgi:hypothetical protein